MKYIITKGQLHRIAYQLLDDELKNTGGFKENEDYGNHRFSLEDMNGDRIMSAVHYSEENARGETHAFIGWRLINKISKLFSIRPTKAVDIIGDWLSETLNLEIDEIDVDNTHKPDNDDY